MVGSMIELPDQHELWEKKHKTGEHERWRDEPNAFARDAVRFMEPDTRLLELGCGIGADSRFFAGEGVGVTATDFSEAAIVQNREIATPGVHYEVMDIAGSYPYAGARFDYVYAHLSLHYYPDKETRRIFGEINRVLKPGGRLFFKCKSAHDPTYGKGEEVEPDMFVWNGHVRHLFSLDYTKRLLDDLFRIERLEEASDTYAGYSSSFVECVASKAGYD